MVYQCPKCGRVHDSSAGDVAAPLQIQARPPLYAQPSMASQLVSPWAQSMAPAWPGPYIHYWTDLVDEYMWQIAARPTLEGTAARVCISRGNYPGVIRLFLLQWYGPAEFKNAFSHSNNDIYFDVGLYVVDPRDLGIAFNAARALTSWCQRPQQSYPPSEHH